MKITMKEVKDNTLVGVVTGLAVTGVLYFFNKQYVDYVKADNNSRLRVKEADNDLLSIELNELKCQNLEK